MVVEGPLQQNPLASLWGSCGLWLCPWLACTPWRNPAPYPGLTRLFPVPFTAVLTPKNLSPVMGVRGHPPSEGGYQASFSLPQVLQQSPRALGSLGKAAAASGCHESPSDGPCHSAGELGVSSLQLGGRVLLWPPLAAGIGGTGMSTPFSLSAGAEPFRVGLFSRTSPARGQRLEPGVPEPP